MKKLLEKRTNPLFAVLVIFLLGFFLINDLDIRYIYIYVLLGIVFVAGILMAGIWHPGMKLKQTLREIWGRITPIKACFLFLVAVTTVLAFLPNSNLGHLVVSLTISMLVFTVYLVFMEPGKKDIHRAFCAIHVMSILFSFYIIAVMLWPNFYWENIYPYLGEYVQSQAAKLLPMGYGVPMGGSSTYTDYILTIALMVNAGGIFIEGAPRDWKRFVFIVLSSVLYVTGILLMGRRSEVLALGAAGLVMLVLHIRPSDKKDSIRRWSAVLAIILVGILVLTPFVKGGYMHRYTSLIEAVLPEQEEAPLPTAPSKQEKVEKPTEPLTKVEKPSADQLTSGRMGLWKTALELFKENPVFGIGWEQFMNHNTYEHDVHNTYLQWLCESGMVGFVLLMTPTMFMYAMTFKRTIRYRRKNRSVSYAVKQMNFVSLGMQTFLLAVNLIDPAYYHLNYFCFYALVIGLEDAAGRLEEETVTRSEKTCLIKAIWESAKLF